MDQQLLQQPTLFGYDLLSIFLLFFFIFLALIFIGIAAALIKRLFFKMPKQKTPYEILMERFASGEIGENEFEEKKRILDVHKPPSGERAAKK
ncbi:MAG: hypothetical protein A2934_02725 [Candidatus Sungbacteria bacterium RIFCSPLOWO2_01_FULL_47_10]|uniref:SHOCT domain-containing protein n=1 Tax=Candidatus Sungbacteria bacterium RIFCSPLOWO2_01_FULL_47_10 TaxID=1802276 RepID=A0A1G2L1U0_9BACT|nr:MAG: hypothetical protein A2934_02725 [Candidatus Sungbacteria bacterium RIFCSPLOWO2_01_FULL_47_10]